MADIHIVEDNQDHADLIVYALQSLRHSIRLYQNGEMFLRNLFDRPGCVLLDLVLPGKSGFEVISDLRARRVSLPVICVTGYRDSASAVKAMHAGAINVLEKPIEVISLRQAVTEAVARDAMHRQRKRDREVIAAKLDSMEEIQRDTLRLLIGGCTNHAAAQRLGISLRTAERHRANILRVLEVRTLNEAAALLARAGIDPTRPSPAGPTPLHPPSESDHRSAR